MKFLVQICIFLCTFAFGLAEAKTTSLLCETFSAGQSALTTGPGSQFTGRDASYSSWSVVVETNEEGKVIKVFLDNEEKEFEMRGDLLKFRAKLIFSLELNVKTGRARTTISGFDTREQGVCKVVAKLENGLLN